MVSKRNSQSFTERRPRARADSSPTVVQLTETSSMTPFHLHVGGVLLSRICVQLYLLLLLPPRSLNVTDYRGLGQSVIGWGWRLFCPLTTLPKRKRGKSIRGNNLNLSSLGYGKIFKFNRFTFPDRVIIFISSELINEQEVNHDCGIPLHFVNERKRKWMPRWRGVVGSGEDLFTSKPMNGVLMYRRLPALGPSSFGVCC